MVSGSCQCVYVCMLASLQDDGYWKTTSKTPRTEEFQAWWKQPQKWTMPVEAVPVGGTQAHARDHEEWVDKVFSPEISDTLRIWAGCPRQVTQSDAHDSTASAASQQTPVARVSPPPAPIALNADLVMKMVRLY